MCTTRKWKTGILLVAMILICGVANAQHWHRQKLNLTLFPWIRKKHTACNQGEKESVHQKAIGYEEELETTDIGSDRYVFATILCNRAQGPPSPSSPSQTLYASLPTVYRYGFVECA